MLVVKIQPRVGLGREKKIAEVNVLAFEVVVVTVFRRIFLIAEQYYSVGLRGVIFVE